MLVSGRMVDEVCNLYAVKRPMREICAAVDLSPRTVFRIVERQRGKRDPRVLMRRRLGPGERAGQVLSLLQCGGVVRAEEVAELIYGDPWPVSWRVVVRVLMAGLRKEGHGVKFRGGGYVLVDDASDVGGYVLVRPRKESNA